MTPSIWNLRPLSRPVQSRHFTDAEQPAWEGITLTLAPLDGVRATRCAVVKAELMRKHVTGVKDAEGNVLEEPEPVKCGDRQKRTPDEVVVDRYAKMAAMWAGEELLPPLSEMLGWQALLYAGWLDIANWIEEVYAAGLEPDSGNRPLPSETRAPAQERPIAASSEPSASITENIPKSPADETPFSAPSNGAYGLSPQGLGLPGGTVIPAGLLPD